MRAGALLLVAGCLALPAKIIDRIAISVGNQVITESQIDEEVQSRQFLNRAPLDLSIAARREAADRLIERALVQREMESSRYPRLPLAEAAKLPAMVRAGYASETQFQAGLRAYAISEDALVAHLRWQMIVLRFLDYRFRPDIHIEDSDVQAYYDEQTIRLQREGQPPLRTLEEERGRIQNVLTERRLQEASHRWLLEARTLAPVRYRNPALESPPARLGPERRRL